MRTPMDAFLEELRKAGWALCVLPGGPEYCAADMWNSVIYLGSDLTETEKGIVGLHELGHHHTIDSFPGIDVFFLILRPEVSYAMELAAWDWARSKMPPGFENDFEKTKETGLSSYLRRKR